MKVVFFFAMESSSLLGCCCLGDFPTKLYSVRSRTEPNT